MSPVFIAFVCYTRITLLIRRQKGSMTIDKLIKLQQVLSGYENILILPHNDPDPDAIGASVGLRYLLMEKFKLDVQIAYQGMIGRAENKALVRYLNLPLQKLSRHKISPNTPVALIDTQPGSGNNPLADNIPASIVIDHHPLRDSTLAVPFSDIRPEIGASSTILTQYLRATELEIPSFLATALFYGIKTDTMGLGRGASRDDVDAYFFLQTRIDVDDLVKIEHAQVPEGYFKSLTSAIQSTSIYEQDLVIAYLGSMEYPDLGAEIADLLLRLQGAKWVICMGVYQGDFILSIRSRSQKIGAGKLVRRIVGELGSAGGHGTMAGGQIELKNQDPIRLFDQISKRALEVIKGHVSIEGSPLI